MEAFSQLQNAQDLDYIAESDVEALRPMFEEISKMISGLTASFQQKL